MNEIQTTAQMIAVELTKATGDLWVRSAKYDGPDGDSNWRALLEGPNSQELFLSTTWASKGRLYIGASLPAGMSKPYNAVIPSITVTKEKSAEKIAADIKRRLLPDYAPLLAKVIEDAVKYAAAEYRRKTVVEEAAAIVGGRVDFKGDTNKVRTEGWDLEVSYSGTIKFSGYGSDLTLEQLRKIQSVCPELFRKNEEE